MYFKVGQGFRLPPAGKPPAMLALTRLLGRRDAYATLLAVRFMVPMRDYEIVAAPGRARVRAKNQKVLDITREICLNTRVVIVCSPLAVIVNLGDNEVTQYNHSQ